MKKELFKVVTLMTIGGASYIIGCNLGQDIYQTLKTKCQSKKSKKRVK